MKKPFTKILDKMYNINNTEELELFNINGYFPKEIFKLKNLRILKLKGSGLIGSIPTEIGNLKKLNHLDLSLNKLSGFIPNQMFDLTNLSSLNLKSNFLTGSIPAEIGNLKKLNHLDLSNNKLDGSIPTSICSLDKIWYIDLTKNCLSGLVSEMFFDFISRKKLPINNILYGNGLKINIS